MAKISTIIQKDPELRDNLKDARIIVYVNACRGREYEELANLEFDSTIGNIQTAETDNISKQLSKEWNDISPGLSGRAFIEGIHRVGLGPRFPELSQGMGNYYGLPFGGLPFGILLADGGRRTSEEL